MSEQGLIDEETQKILKFVNNRNLYRRGDWLYDVDKLKPLYSITELSWNQCSYPKVAYQVSDELGKLIPCIPSSRNMSEDEIFQQVDLFFELLNSKELNYNDRLKCRCEMYYFLTEKKVADLCVLLDNGIDNLKYYDKRGWEPAKYFLKKMKEMYK